MTNETMTWAEESQPVAARDVETRATFISRTYTHLFGAIVAFIVVEWALLQTPIAQRMYEFIAGAGWRWLLFLGGFMVVGMLASRTAHVAKAKGAQYAALLGYVLAEAVIFLPLLYVADEFARGGVIQSGAAPSAVISGLPASKTPVAGSMK